MPFAKSCVSAIAAAGILSLAVPARAQDAGEPLPPGAPSEPYELSAWCYGALAEYLDIYGQVKPEIRAIDKLFGSSVKNEAEPYASDVAAARGEVKVLSRAVEAAERASARPISDRGAAAVRQGRAIWAPAESRTHRELARAWMSWALPDRCDSNARELAARSALLGQALRYNTGDDAKPAPAADADKSVPAADGPAPPSAPKPTSPAEPKRG